jgi:acyl-CoA thioester hydrolase
MTHFYTRPFPVRHYELDRLGHVNNAVYLNYLQQAAIEASTDAGYSPERYHEMGLVWVARNTIIEHGRPAVYGDTVTVKTWVSDLKRVQSHRQYLLTHAASGEIVARAQTNWALLDRVSLQLARVPEAMAASFQPNGEVSPRHLKPGVGEKATSEAKRYLSQRGVQHYELDPVQHVNNAVYLNWVEQAFFDACLSCGYSPQQMADEFGVIFVVRRNEIDYLAPALAEDTIEISSWVNSIARTHGTWIHQMRCSKDDKLLVQVHSMGAFVSPNGKPVRLPDRLKNALLGDTASY